MCSRAGLSSVAAEPGAVSTSLSPRGCPAKPPSPPASDSAGVGNYANAAVLRTAATMLMPRRLVVYVSMDYTTSRELRLYGIVNGYGSDGDQRGHHGGALLLETNFERRASDVALHYEGTGNENSLNHYNVLRFEDATLV
jgi:hypothetical protein